MSKRRSLRGIPLVGAAFAGVMAGHWLTYLAGLPSGHLRAEVLRATGHGYWPAAVELSATLAILAVAVLGRREARAVLGEEAPPPEGPASVAVRLALLQVAGFIALEVGERVAAGAPLSGLLQHHLFILGLLVQVAVALITALLLFVLSRAAQAVARALLRPRFPRPVRHSFPRPLLLAPPLAALAGSAGARAPPPR